MVKELKKLFRNLINKSNPPAATSESKLEIDAAVVPANNNNDNNIERQQSDEQQQTQQQTYNNNERNDSGFSEQYSTSTSQNNSVVPSMVNSLINDNSQILPQSQSSSGTLSVNSPTIATVAPTTSTTVGEVNNVQNIYNFSNMDGLHIGNSILIHNNITNENRNSNRNRNYVNNSREQQQQQQPENNDELNEINLEQKQNKKRIKITPGIEQLFRSRVDVQESVLNELSEYVGKNYQNLMRYLGLTQAQIQIVELDYNVIGHKEIIFQLLLKWSEEFYEIANYGKLSRNLWRCNCRDAVVKLEQILSRIQLENQKEEITEK